jgi:hypothetical protein
VRQVGAGGQGFGASFGIHVFYLERLQNNPLALRQVAGVDIGVNVGIYQVIS